MTKPEMRYYAFDSGDESVERDGKRVLVGKPIVFNSRTNIGPFDEVIDPHALDHCDLTDVRLCLNHDKTYVYARSRNNNDNSTMRLKVEPQNVTIEAELSDAPKAIDLWTAVKRGDISDMSFLFIVDDDEWSDIMSDHPTRVIKGIKKVYEVSCVTFPAYADTSVSARSAEELESSLATLESAREAEKNKADTEKRELLLAELRSECNERE